MITESRVYPVDSKVVMRSTLFALANMGATLQAYNEDSGVIVATVPRWLGLRRQEVVARVRANEATSQLEIEAPDAEKTRELLQLITTYVRDGARVQANATMQWIDMQREQESRARRQQLTNRARSLLSPGAPETAVATIAPGGDDVAETAEVVDGEVIEDTEPDTAAAAMAELPLPIPDNPGVLVKNRQNMIVELKVDPETFHDRTTYLERCNACQAVAVRGSAYCANCGRPLTLEAVQPAMRHSAQRSANSALTFGLVGLALNIVPLLVLVLPALLTQPQSASLLERIGANLSPLTIALTALLGIVPAIAAGTFALRQGQQASWYLNLPAISGEGGRGKSAAGNALGWLSIYLAIGWILLIVIALVV